MYREALPPAPTGGAARGEGRLLCARVEDRGRSPRRDVRWPRRRGCHALLVRERSHPRPRKRLQRSNPAFHGFENPRFPRRSAGAPPLPCARQTRSRHDRGEEGAAEERRRRPGVRRRVRGVRQRRCVSSSRARRDFDPVRPRDLVGFASSLPLSDRPRPANVSDRQSGAPRKRTPRMSSSGRRTGTTPTRTTTSLAS